MGIVKVKSLNFVFIRGIRNGIKLKPEVVSSKKALKVAVIGPPNVGKSAITNTIIKADLCAVSKRMDTTRFVSFRKELWRNEGQ